MPRYSYQALNENGVTISDIIEADSAEMVNGIIASRGYIPVSVRELGRGSAGVSWRNLIERLAPIKTPELILFTKQFKTMLRAGVSIVKILQVLENQCDNPNLKRIIVTISNDIREGASLFDAFKKHPRPFLRCIAG